MYGAIIGAIGSIGGAIAGGVMSANQAAENRERIAKMRERNRTWYTLDANAKESERAGAQARISKTAEELAKYSRQTRGYEAVTGSTGGQVARVNETAAETLANINSKTAEIDAQNAREARNQYHQNEITVDNAESGYAAQNAANMQANINNATSVLSKIGSVVDAGIGSKGSGSGGSNAPTLVDTSGVDKSVKQSIDDSMSKIRQGGADWLKVNKGLRLEDMIRNKYDSKGKAGRIARGFNS